MREPMIYLCRHGDTAWSAERRLAGRTDIPLVERGEENARRLGRRLAAVSFDHVMVSPLVRARRTAELAGIAAPATVDERLLEMDFGRYDGLTIDEIRREQPGWTWRDGCPGGEGPEDLGRRADILLGNPSAASGHVAFFAHSVILRVVAARFLGLPPESARMFMLAPGSLSILGYDRVDDSRAIASWNDQQHLSGQTAFA